MKKMSVAIIVFVFVVVLIWVCAMLGIINIDVLLSFVLPTAKWFLAITGGYLIFRFYDWLTT